MNAKDNIGRTAWHRACQNGKTITAQLIIQSSKDFGIDLNAKDDNGWTALHAACLNGKTETVQMILKIWKEFGIDIKAQDNNGEEYNQIKKMLEKEYSLVDVTEPPTNKPTASATIYWKYLVSAKAFPRSGHT